MFSNVLNAGKDIANKLTNKFLNLSDIEVKIKEATNDDNWGPNGSLMKEISDETYSTSNFHDVMTYLWYRIFAEKPHSNRRTYKGLVLLSYLIVNGSDFVAVSCKAHIHEISKLKSYYDSNGMPDISIRKKANDLCDLLDDPQRLSDERNRAKTYKNRNYRSESVTGLTSYDSKKINAQSMIDIDEWEPDSKSIPYVIGESFMNFVNTFTQNISGPPPTETHDNFDIHPMEYEITEPIQEDSFVKPVLKTIIKEVPKTEILDSKETKPVKEVNLSAKSNPEVPIIDFSDLCEEPSKMSTCPTIMDTDFDDEFDKLRSYEDFNSITQEKAIQPQPARVFYANFDNLASPKLVSSNKTSSVINNIKTETSNTIVSPTVTKTEVKIGATWNELDSLKIDLDNLVGGRKHVYSKS